MMQFQVIYQKIQKPFSSLSIDVSTVCLDYISDFITSRFFITLRYPISLKDIGGAQTPWKLIGIVSTWYMAALISSHTGGLFCYFADNEGGMNVRDWLQSAICGVLRDLERYLKIAPQRLPNPV